MLRLTPRFCLAHPLFVLFLRRESNFTLSFPCQMCCLDTALQRKVRLQGCRAQNKGRQMKVSLALVGSFGIFAKKPKTPARAWVMVLVAAEIQRYAPILQVCKPREHQTPRTLRTESRYSTGMRPRGSSQLIFLTYSYAAGAASISVLFLLIHFCSLSLSCLDLLRFCIGKY